MKYYSTKNPSSAYSLREAVLTGLPADRGLFMPEKIPQLPKEFFIGLKKKSFVEIAFAAANAWLNGDVPESMIHKIVAAAISFDAPVVKLDERIHILELFHGPTLAFKDFGARFMARLMEYLIRDTDRELTILVATSGDTGSAVAHGFYEVEGIHVVILYPSGMVSPLQEKQLTTLNKNITALEISGTFDDCQHLVKQAFTDIELSRRLQITSANSINIGRLIPQSFYYFYAVAQLDGSKPVVFSVPSGNFGNLTAGLMAKGMGLPIKKFVASTNANKVFTTYLSTGTFQPAPSVSTISNAMDVGHPSNFERMLHLYNHSADEMRRDMCAYSFGDDETRSKIKEVYGRFHYILDPHGAVGLLGLENYFSDSGQDDCGVVLETAHPAKFRDVVDEVLGFNMDLPKPLAEAALKNKNALPMKNDFHALKAFLIEEGKS